MADLAYELPDGLIARRPPHSRDGGRLLVVSADPSADPCAPGAVPLRDADVVQLPDFLRAGDLMVVNDTRVVPARLFAQRITGGSVEALILQAGAAGLAPETWRLAMLRPGRRLRAGETLSVEDGAGEIRLERRLEDGTWWVSLRPSTQEVLDRAGHMPLPPYLQRPDEPADRVRYQTVYAGPEGAVAAPTAGLHLSRRLLAELSRRGVGLATVTLHVGPGTFRPLRPADLASGLLHAEPWSLPEATAEAILETRRRGGRILAVGTTSTRVLEAAGRSDGTVCPGAGTTRIFLRPGSRFSVVDRLLTNLHLPGSSLLALVQAFGGVEPIQAAYRHAVQARYRFYSYGDAMLLDLDPPGRGASA